MNHYNYKLKKDPEMDKLMSFQRLSRSICEKSEQSYKIIHALAHQSRLSILKYIDSKKTTIVNDIFRELRIEQSQISEYLAILENANIIKRDKKGKYVHCSLNYELLSRVESAVNNFNKI